MARTGKVRVDIIADASGVQRGVVDAERSLSRLEKSGSRAMSALKVSGLAAGAALGTGLAAAVATGVRELQEAEKASAQTAATLKSTGAAAKVTKTEIEGLATALQRQTGVADDVIQSGQNLLLTFTNIKNEAGRGNDIFDRTTRTMLDLSVAMDQDVKASALQLGKALNDPIAGVSALREVGVSFTQQQQDQIRTLVESNRTLDAQKVILAELNKQVGGSAVAAGNTTVGQLERIKRAWEEASQTLVIKFMPIFTRVAQSILDNMDKVEAVFAGIATAANGMVKFVGALFRGDWQRAWQIAADGAGKALRAIGILAEKVLLPLAQKAGRAIVRGIAQGFNEEIRRLPAGSFLYRILRGESIVGAAVGIQDDGGVSFSGSGEAAIVSGGGGTPRPVRGGSSAPLAPSRRPSLARGGEVPGRLGQAVPIVAHAGEVVLNPTQQRIVGIDRIMATLARTGGVTGGSSFAAGGVVGGGARYTNPFPGGNWAGGPSAHAARALGNWQSDNAWDIMGSTGQAVYAVLPGTIGRVSASDSRPGFAGQGVYLDTADGQWWYKHIRASVSPGQKVNAGDVIGTLVSWTNGGPHLHLATPSGDPARAKNGMAPGVASSSAGDGQGAEPSPPKPAGPTLAQRIAKLVGPTTAKALGTGAPDLSDGSAPAFTGSQNRSVSAAGRNARNAARAAGMSPEAVANAGDEAERAAEVAVLNRQLSAAQNDLKSLKSRKADKLTQYQRLGRTKVGPKNRAAKRKAMAKMRADLRSYTEEMSEVREEIADIQERLAEIGEQAASEDYQEAYDDRTRAADAASSAATDTSTSTPTGPSPDQQVAIDQANTRADNAERGQGISDSFLRTLFGSGSIDPGAGSVTVNIQTLHPGDPAIQGEVARWVVGALGGQGSVPASTFRV